MLTLLILLTHCTLRRLFRLCEIGFNEVTHLYTTPSLALKLGHSLKKASMIVVNHALINGDERKEKQGKNFNKLVSDNWDIDVSCHALRTLHSNKRNNPKLLPLTSDVMLLSKYLKEKAEMCTLQLNKEEPSEEVWRELERVTLTQLLLFNRKRQGEVSKITLEDYSQLKKGSSHVLDVQFLSKIEKELVNVLWRVEIIGKRGRTVPVLITNTMKSGLDLLLEKRGLMNIRSSNPYLFPSGYGSASHLRGSDTLRNYSVKCGAKQPHLLRST
ncbi:uncharacterized protein LOC117117976 [Anneissia japonica]|uniref:uncharacterized protein LOC117117976 n=1 Tax=Anneissia japonica TaxID=1529436 RepID=UPI0014257BCD|nr:uncharacterized protein LOC117117976 [Anneissia japonica]